MFLNPNRILQTISGVALTIAIAAGAQTPTTPDPAPTTAPAAAPAAMPAPAAAPAPAQADQPAAPAAAPDPKPWRVGPMDVSGFLDGYYSYNRNDPAASANGQMNDLYNFNDKTDQWSLSAAKLTLNHDPTKLVGAHIDLIYGRTNRLVNTSSQLKFVEQAFLSFKPAKAKGFELDLGKWVTSAGAEVIESKDNWNYSRSLLFAWAIPYYHFGIRTSMPVSKTETVGVQIVNGWNNITKSTGGVTVGLTSALVEPKYTWFVNVYTGPENFPFQHGYRNLIDTTILLTPNPKFNAYINYDLGVNNDSISNGVGDNVTSKWTGIAVAAHQQITSKIAAAGRLEFFDDMQGYATGTPQQVKEFTATGEYHWPIGLLARAEFRHDWSDTPIFHKGATDMVDSQSTVTVGLVAIFAPKR